MMKYQWKNGARLSGDANEIGKHLDRLRKRKGGVLTPQVVLDDAMTDESPLHDFFEWDDEEAAFQHRLSQARYLIRSVEVIIESGSKSPVRAYFLVKEEDGERAYEHVRDVMKNPVKRAQVVARAKEEFEALKRKYEHLTELADFVIQLGREWK